jgi:hypothetical protein
MELSGALSINGQVTGEILLGQGLLDQQMWCWGRDIRHPGGNILCRYGFLPQRPANPDCGSTAYVLTPRPELTIVLWGFGMFYGDAERTAMFLKRYEFTPRLTSQRQTPWAMWDPARLSFLRDPAGSEERIRIRGLFTEALDWIGSYERWVVERFGVEYRRQCVAGWSKAVVAAETMADTWRGLAIGWGDRADALRPLRVEES